MDPKTQEAKKLNQQSAQNIQGGSGMNAGAQEAQQYNAQSGGSTSMSQNNPSSSSLEETKKYNQQSEQNKGQ